MERPSNSADSDDFNSDATERKIWIALAQNHDVHVRAFNFTTPIDLCLHNDAVRALGGPLVYHSP
jgi:bifunctional polynucleotide phosphatase/kinase